MPQQFPPRLFRLDNIFFVMNCVLIIAIKTPKNVVK